jgi:hypothetical protein
VWLELYGNAIAYLMAVFLTRSANGISILTKTGNGFTILLQMCWFNIPTERCGKFAHALAMKTAPTQETHLFSGKLGSGNQMICRVSAQRQCGMTVLKWCY